MSAVHTDFKPAQVILKFSHSRLYFFFHRTVADVFDEDDDDVN